MLSLLDPLLDLVSLSVTGLTGDVTAPAAPTGLAAVAGVAQVTLSWNAVGDADHYIIERGGVRIDSTDRTIYTDTGLTVGESYTYQVRAVDGAGWESDPSASVPVTLSLPLPDDAIETTGGAFSILYGYDYAAANGDQLRVKLDTDHSYAGATAVNLVLADGSVIAEGAIESPQVEADGPVAVFEFPLSDANVQYQLKRRLLGKGATTVRVEVTLQDTTKPPAPELTLTVTD